MKESDDYTRYRGKCKQYSEFAVFVNPELKLVRGHYFDALWGEQAHWWTVFPNGVIYDPTKNQFPTKGKGIYEEFDGWLACAECGTEVHENTAVFYGNYGTCSDKCMMRLVGLDNVNY